MAIALSKLYLMLSLFYFFPCFFLGFTSIRYLLNYFTCPFFKFGWNVIFQPYLSFDTRFVFSLTFRNINTTLNVTKWWFFFFIITFSVFWVVYKVVKILRCLQFHFKILIPVPTNDIKTLFGEVFFNWWL